MTVLDLITDSQRCVQLFQRLRWPHGVRCLRCRSRRVKRHGTYRDGLNRYRCRRCGATVTDKTGTILEESKLPLRKWLQGMSRLSLNGSIRTLADHLALHDQSARRMGPLIQGSLLWHRFPRRLRGTVEVDDCYLRAGNKGPVRGKKAPHPPPATRAEAEGKGQLPRR